MKITLIVRCIHDLWSLRCPSGKSAHNHTDNYSAITFNICIQAASWLHHVHARYAFHTTFHIYALQYDGYLIWLIHYLWTFLKIYPDLVKVVSSLNACPTVSANSCTSKKHLLSSGHPQTPP